MPLRACRVEREEALTQLAATQTQLSTARTDLAAEKLERVLTNDPGTGVLRHVDAGYERAEEVADERGVRVPMREDAG